MENKESVPASQELWNFVRRFTLSKSLFTNVFTIRREEIDNCRLTKEKIEEINKNQAIKQLAELILSRTDCTESRETHLGVEYRTEVLVLKKSELKLIVEAAIEVLSDQQIAMIKNGIRVL